MRSTPKGWRSIVTDLLFNLAGGFLYALGLYTFAKMGDFAPGGISGLALIGNHLWGFPIGLTTILLNVPLVVLSYRVVGRRFILKSLGSMGFGTFFLDVIFPLFPTYQGSSLLAALYAGACCGAGMGLYYIRGSSSGGTDFLTMTIKTLHPHFSIGSVTMVLDLAIILLGWPVFGHIESVLYGLIMTFVCSFVIDKIMYGVDAGKLVLIITAQGTAVAERIMEVSHRGATSVQALGNYTNRPRCIVFCACTRSESYRIKNAALEIDPFAFILVHEINEIYGRGFIEPKNYAGRRDSNEN